MNADGELRILVADDEPSMLDLMIRRLKKMGITPDQASDGAQAQALIEQNDYDVIVSDIYMPDVTGLELLHLAKERDPNVQVVIATASATIDNAVDALNNGAFGYLTKPFDHLSVFDKIVTRAMEFRQLLLDNQRMAEVQKRRGDMLEEEVTQRIRQLRDRQRDLLNLLTSLPLGVTVVEEGGRVVMRNPLAERWLAEEKLAKEHPIRAFMATVHQGDSEPSVEVVVSGRTIRLTAVDILQGTPKKQKVVIIGEMEHEEEGISQGTMVEETVDRLSEGLMWLANQPLETRAGNVVRGLVREIVSLGRMMGLDIEGQVVHAAEPTLAPESYVEDTTKPGASVVDDEDDERLLAALRAATRLEETPPEEAEPPRRAEPPKAREPISKPVQKAGMPTGDQPPRQAERAPEPESPVAKSERPPAGRPPGAAGRPAAESPVSQEIPPTAQRTEPDVEPYVKGPPTLEEEPPPPREVRPVAREEGPEPEQAQPPAGEESPELDEAERASKEERKAPIFKSRLLRKAKELESGGWKPGAGASPKSGTNGKSREEPRSRGEPDEAPADPVLSRLAQVTEDSSKVERTKDDSQRGQPPPKTGPKPEPAREEGGPRPTAYEEGDTGGDRDRGIWPPPLPSSAGEEEGEEPSSEA